MVKTYKIEIDCANCANSAERKASKVKGVKSLSLSYMAQKLTVEFEETADQEAVLAEIVKVCKKVERDFVLYGV